MSLQSLEPSVVASWYPQGSNIIIPGDVEQQMANGPSGLGESVNLEEHLGCGRGNI